MVVVVVYCEQREAAKSSSALCVSTRLAACFVRVASDKKVSSTDTSYPVAHAAAHMSVLAAVWAR